MPIRVILVSFAAVATAAAQIPPGDSSRGRELFTSEKCVQCHSVTGQGGKLAPDLVRGIDRDYTPTSMATLMWNHAPEMWEAMRQAGVEQPSLTPQKAADLFAFFVAARYFDPPGDAARGKRTFAEKGCESCHGITSSPMASAPPVTKWESLASPVVLAQQMWNHGAGMSQAIAGKKAARPQLTAQDLSDVLVYLRNLPETRSLPRQFQFASANQGAELFKSKGCEGCHTGRMTLDGKLRDQSPTDIAAAMWNHQPAMKNARTLTAGEMSQIMDYVWARQFFSADGNADRGAKVFASKGCGSCHNQASGGAPSLASARGTYSDITIVSALWQHGPQMLNNMKAKNMAWPRFTNAREMADLIAYLNAL